MPKKLIAQIPGPPRAHERFANWSSNKGPAVQLLITKDESGCHSWAIDAEGEIVGTDDWFLTLDDAKDAAFDEFEIPQDGWKEIE